MKHVTNKSILNKTFPVYKKDGTALITFTTGSTGIPKAAKRTHEFLYYQFSVLIGKIQPGEDDIDMPVLPIVLLINLGTGTTSVIANFKASKPNSLNPKKILKQIKEHLVNRITASPFMAKEISKYIISHKLCVQNIRNIVTVEHLYFQMKQRYIIKAFPNAKVEIVYGSTKAEAISSINAKELISKKNNIQAKGLMVGKVDKNVEVKIIKIIDNNIYVNSDQELLSIELRLKKIGEIIVSGDHVLREYFNNVEALYRNKIFIRDKCWHRQAIAAVWMKRGC